MYNVMIVDDEEPVLDSFSYILEQGIENFQLCGVARSGEEAVQKALILKPDLIFMDIQMPGMDGLEAIGLIKKSHPEILFILATAYERFDIARKAIQLNVLNYLVKPVTKKKFLNELERVREELDSKVKEKAQLGERGSHWESSKRKIESDFVRSLNASISAKEWQRAKKELGFRSDRGAILVLDLDSEMRLSDKQSLYIRIKEKTLFKYLCFLSFSGERGLFFFPEEEDLSALYGRLKDILQELDMNCRIGQGGVYPYEELALSYKEALEPFLIDTNAHLFERGQISRILSLVKRGDQDAFCEDMYFLADTLFTTWSFKVALGEMISVFSLILGELGFFTTNQCEDLPLNPAEEIISLENMDEWSAWFHYGLEKITSVMTASGTSDLPEPLEKAIEHIKLYYTEQIYLGSVAQDCGVSSSYLSRLFSEHMNCPFTDYLNRHRVDQALSLLKENKVSVKEAAYKTGFNDPNYFSKIFRKYKGISPSEA